MNYKRKKLLIIRIVEWTEYGLILSFMPIGVTLLLATLFGYSFSAIDIYSDLLLTIVGLAVTNIKDINSISINDYGKNCLLFLVFLIIITASVLYGGIFIHERDTVQELDVMALNSIGKAVITLLVIILTFGTVLQIYCGVTEKDGVL